MKLFYLVSCYPEFVAVLGVVINAEDHPLAIILLFDFPDLSRPMLSAFDRGEIFSQARFLKCWVLVFIAFSHEVFKVVLE